MFNEYLHFFFRGKLWKWLTGSVTAVIGISHYGYNYLKLSFLYSVLLAIGAIIVILLTGFAIYFFRRRTKSKYGEAIIELNQLFAYINELKRNNSENPKEIMSGLFRLCDSLKIVFDKITNVDCSISIKIPTYGSPISDNAIVENLCRDYNHYLVRNTDEYKRQTHKVNGNTAYQVVLSNVLNGDRTKFCYINNNVPRTAEYRTTSKPAYPGGKLPYKSEIVYPILPIDISKATNNKEKFEIWGFICIDCDHAYKFNSPYDVAIVQGVADGIFDVIMKINKSRTVN